MQKENISFTNIPDLIDLDEFLMEASLEPKSAPLIENHQVLNVSQQDIQTLIPFIKESSERTSKYL